MNNAQFANLCDQIAELKEAVMSTKTTARPKTLNRGAADARALVKKAIRAELREWLRNATRDDYQAAYDFTLDLIKRIDAQAKNASKRPSGGLGRVKRNAK